MANNLIANTPAVCVCSVATTFAAAGVSSSNISIIYLVDNPLLSFVPDREINAITSFALNKGYYIIPKINLDFSAFLQPPIPGPAGFDSAVIVADGNSLTLGFQASNPSKAYPARLHAKTPFLLSTIINKGVNGQTTLNMTADASTDIDPLYTAAARSIVIFWEMGNDYLFNGNNATNCFNNARTYCLGRKAAGWKVVAMTCPDRGDIDSTGRLAMNALLVANYHTFADALVDLAADTRLQDHTNLTYFNADGIHLQDLGYQVVADLSDPVIEAMVF